MALSSTAKENNSSYNNQQGVQIKVNTEEDLWDENDMFARTLIPAMIFVGILMVAGCVGNALVVYIFGFKFKSATQHSLIVCLACFDLLMSSIAMPSEIADMRYHHTFSSAFACKLLRFITMFSAVASSLILVVIAVDRHKRVTKPLTRQMTVRHARIWEAVSVCAALLFSWPSVVLSGLRTTETKVPGLMGTDCSVSNHFNDTKFPFAHNAVLGIGFVVIITVLAVLYFRIWKTAKYHLSQIFSRPKATLAPAFSDAGKANGDVSVNSSPTAFIEIAAIGCTIPEKESDKENLTKISSSLTSSQAIDISHSFYDMDAQIFDVPEDRVIKSCSEGLCNDESLQINPVIRRRLDLNCRTEQNKNVFNFDRKTVAEKADPVHFNFRIRAKSLEEISSTERIIQISPTSKISSALSSPGISFRYLLHEDRLFKSTSLGRRQTSASNHKYIRSLAPEIMKPSFNLEQARTGRDARDLEVDNGTIGTNSWPQNKLFMCKKTHEMNLDNKEHLIVEDNLKIRTKIPHDSVASVMKYCDIDEYNEKLHTNICRKTSNLLSSPAVCKHGHKRCPHLILSDTNVSLEDFSSVSTNSTSLEDIDVSRSTETKGRNNLNQQLNLRDSSGITETHCHILDGCCCRGYPDKVGQTDVAPLDEHIMEDATHQLPHKQVARLFVLDLVPAPHTSHVIGETCKPIDAVSDAMIDESVTAREESDRQVDCERHVNKTLQRKIKKPKNICLATALPCLFNRYPMNDIHDKNSKHSNLQLSPKASIFSVTNKQGSIYEQHSDGDKQRRISAKTTTESFKVTCRRPSRQNDKTTLVAFSISTVFVVSFLPYLALMFVRAFLKDFDYNLQGGSLCVYNIFLRFYLLNSAANPLLYGLLNERFRQECKTILFYFCPGSNKLYH
ncbi:hypothetical protein BsWGS_14095 [Bradybaena similaris]